MITDSLHAGKKARLNASYEQRLAHLKTLQALLKSNEQRFFEALRQDFQKPEFEVYLTEMFPVLEELSVAIKNLKRWIRPQAAGTPLALLPSRAEIYHEPKGVVLIIGAWNYPVNLTLAPLVAALAAGNYVVLKPSELAPATSSLIRELLDTHLDSRVVKVVEGDGPFTSALLDEPFDHIFYTGSTAVGKIVYEKAARQLCPVTLELGGKSPAIIHEKVNLKQVVKRLVWGKFVNAGQTCVAPDYVLLPKKLEAEFQSVLRDTIDAFQLNQPENQCAIINARHFQRITRMLDGNYRVLIGGTSEESKLRIEPTAVVVSDVQHPLMQEEIFGPVLPVILYENWSDIQAIYDAHPNPLALYVFSTDSSFTEQILAQLPSGGVLVNDTLMHLANSNLPFGGRGASGFGSYHGKSGFATFSHAKSVMRQATWFDPWFRYAPYTSKRYTFLRRLTRLFVG